MPFSIGGDKRRKGEVRKPKRGRVSTLQLPRVNRWTPDWSTGVRYLGCADYIPTPVRIRKMRKSEVLQRLLPHITTCCLLCLTSWPAKQSRHDSDNKMALEVSGGCNKITAELRNDIYFSSVSEGQHVKTAGQHFVRPPSFLEAQARCLLRDQLSATRPLLPSTPVGGFQQRLPLPISAGR